MGTDGLGVTSGLGLRVLGVRVRTWTHGTGGLRVLVYCASGMGLGLRDSWSGGT